MVLTALVLSVGRACSCLLFPETGAAASAFGTCGTGCLFGGLRFLEIAVWAFGSSLSSAAVSSWGELTSSSLGAGEGNPGCAPALEAASSDFLPLLPTCVFVDVNHVAILDFTPCGVCVLVGAPGGVGKA